MVERIEGAMVTRDGLWRIEAIRDRGRHFYRLWHIDRIYQDHLVIGSLHYFLEMNGVDPADLVEDEDGPDR